MGGQAKGRHAVDEAEVDDLGHAALVGDDFIQRHAEHLGGGGGVDVAVFGKGGQQAGVVGQVRHDAQFDLRIIGRHQHMPGRRDEGLADAAALGGACGNVLQVGLGTREPAGDRRGLRITGVHATGARVDHLRQLVGVGRFQLGHAPVVEDGARDGVVERELLQGFLVGGGRAARRLLDDRQTFLCEENVANLLGRAQVEGLAGFLIGALFQLQHLLAQFAALHGKQLAVELDAVAFHAEEDVGDRQLNLPIHEIELVGGGNRGGEGIAHTQRHVGIFGGVFARALDRDFFEADARGTLAGHVVVADRGETQMARGEVAEFVRLVGFEHVRLQQRVVEDAREPDAVVGEDMTVVFEVLADDFRRGVFQNRTQLVQCGGAVELFRRAGVAVRQRQVGGNTCLGSKRDADQFGLHGVEARGFGVERKARGSGELGDPAVECRCVEDRFIVRAVVAAVVLLGLRGTGIRAGRWGFASRGGVEIAQPGAEFVACVKRTQRLGVGRCGRQRVERERQRNVGFDRDQHAGLRQPVLRGAQVLADHAFHTVGLGDQMSQRAVFGQPFHGGLGADLGDAGDVVHAVADEREVIDDAFGRHAELGGHAGNVERFLAHGVDQRHVVVDQLRHVLVAGGDDASDARARGVDDQRADHVIGLHALDHHQRPAFGTHGFVQRLDLAAQVVRHRRAVGLVVGVEIVAEGLALRVEHAGDIIGRVFATQLAQHGEHAAQRVGGLAR